MKQRHDLAPIALRAIALTMLGDCCAASDAASPTFDYRAMLDLLRAAPGEDAPLLDLAARYALDDAELLAAALCLAAEQDPAVARIVAAAQQPVGGARPLAGLAARAFGCDALTLAGGAALRIGLLTLGDEAAPLVERSLAMPLPVAAALIGATVFPDGVRALTGPAVTLPPSLADAAAAQAARATDGATVLAIRSACEREGVALAQAIAAALGRSCADLGEGAPAAHACWLHAAKRVPVMRRRLGPSDRWAAPPPGDHRGLVILLPGLDGTIEAAAPVTEWRVAIPGEDERAALWRGAGLSKATATRAAAAYRQGAGRIAELGERLDPAAIAEDDWSALVDAVELGSAGLDQLARRSPARVERSALVIPGRLASGLDHLVARIARRNRLADRLGPALRARYRPGVRALFTGESGTGKTLAAHWLARETGLPLYRVDLAAMTSKWIGETEKNLSAVLDAAQHADVLLFFDEADALFGARTDVGDANDRYANAQTNYLLQRIEDFDGVAVLATNSRDRFDPAFVRRLDVILEFPLPDAAARRDLWCAHLGGGHALSAEEIDALSVAVDLAGGHIRNIALGAEVRALGRGAPIALGDIAAAAGDEYAKLGRLPPALAGPLPRC